MSANSCKSCVRRDTEEVLEYYNETSSSTFFDYKDPEVCNLSYGLGTITGIKAKDQLSIDNNYYFDQDFVLVQDQKDFDQMQSTSLIGLAFEGLQHFKSTLFVNNLVKNKLINDRMF